MLLLAKTRRFDAPHVLLLAKIRCFDAPHVLLLAKTRYFDALHVLLLAKTRYFDALHGLLLAKKRCFDALHVLLAVKKRLLEGGRLARCRHAVGRMCLAESAPPSPWIIIAKLSGCSAAVRPNATPQPDSSALAAARGSGVLRAEHIRPTTHRCRLARRSAVEDPAALTRDGTSVRVAGAPARGRKECKRIICGPLPKVGWADIRRFYQESENLSSFFQKICEPFANLRQPTELLNE